MPQTYVLKQTSFWRHQLSSPWSLCTSADTVPGYANLANQSLGTPGMASSRLTSLCQEPYFSRNGASSTSWEFCSEFGLSLLAHGVLYTQ